MHPDSDRRDYPAIDSAQIELAAEFRSAARNETRRRSFLKRLRTPAALVATLAICIPAGFAIARIADQPEDGRPVTADGTPFPDGPLGIVVVNDQGEVVTCPDGEPLVATRSEAVATLKAAKAEGRSTLPMPRCADGSVPDDAAEMRERYIGEDGEEIPGFSPDQP